MTDRIKAKLEQLRGEADAAVTRAEDAEAKNKQIEQALLVKEQELNSTLTRAARLETENEKLSQDLETLKRTNLDGETSLKDASNKQKKIELLEEELDKAEQNLRETAEKLRQVDAKAEQLERQVRVLEQDKEALEKKYRSGRQVQEVPSGARRVGEEFVWIVDIPSPIIRISTWFACRTGIAQIVLGSLWFPASIQSLVQH
ncbi:hypothetical protein FA15DRAFT_307645 [Coprinopsis marcescibilis]|uniref:Uncharacterized protein n=1 Tax=Coprinopsis marcescibilis TaxID=230819 RepID=A0A5C3L0U1_COPMA|nr:hypothetical protein FA15DRAFT_307645 [Coprinopsis marcescibilis]